jgi:chemotaxis protein CheD
MGLAVWDPVARVGALAHFMLPSGTKAGSPVKYIDSGLPWFLGAFASAGASPRRSQYRAAGGAAMFLGAGGGLDVGRRNGEALVAALQLAGLRLFAQDLGGTTGRSLELDLSTGRLSVRTIHQTSII